jgi:hypothetical protein
MTISTRQGHCTMRRRTLAAAVASIVLAPSAIALQFDTGNPDLEVRWDNSFKYNMMMRVEGQDGDVINSKSPALFDDADLGFDKGIVSNRADLLTELDLVWKQKLGFRVSGSGWYDHAYGQDNDHPGVNKRFLRNGNYTDTWGSLSVAPGEYTDKAEDQAYKGAELLDAFVFANFDVGDMEASVRAGRHTLYWGQSLFVGGAVNGIAGSMAPIDLAKGLGVPGSEAKELFMPTNKFSTSLQVNSSLSLLGYYSFEFKPTRYPAPGTYLALSEVSTDNAEFATLVPGQVDPVTGALVAPRAGLVQKGSEKPEEGEWGIGLQYVFEESGLELGVYYLNYHDKYPQGITGVIDYGQFVSSSIYSQNQAFVPLIPLFWPQGAAPYNRYEDLVGGGYPAQGVGRFKWTYREDNDLFGISLGKEIAGISVGMDLVYRKDVAINFGTAALLNVENYATLGGPALVTNAQAAIDAGLTALGANLSVPFDFDAADESNYPGPTGDTWHIVINGLGFLNPNAWWDGGSYAAEVTFSALHKLGDNPHLVHPDIREDRVLSTVAFSFTPQWYQVLPSLDLKVPFTVSYGIDGQTPISSGGNEGIGSGSIGLAFDYEQVWAADLKYNFYFGSQDNGPIGNLKDRDNVSFTVKRTF